MAAFRLRIRDDELPDGGHYAEDSAEDLLNRILDQRMKMDSRFGSQGEVAAHAILEFSERHSIAHMIQNSEIPERHLLSQFEDAGFEDEQSAGMVVTNDNGEELWLEWSIEPIN